jgi:putative endonuclease
MFFTYVLKSLKNNRFYYGCTNDLKRRLNEHNLGKSKYTRLTTPFELIYFEPFQNLNEARKREKFFKSGKGREYIKSQLTRAVA